MGFLTRNQMDALFHDEKQCIDYLIEQEVFYERYGCPGCDRPMKRIVDKQVFRCQNGACGRRQLSLRKGTFFFGSRLRCLEIMKLAHLWLSGATRAVTINQTGHSSKTVTSFYSYFRQLVVSALGPEATRIGGEGVEVEVDETKMGKRKYHRGHRVEGVWCIVGVERTPERKMFVVPVKNRDSETIDSVLCDHVQEGSIIYTDCWRGYSHLALKFGFIHRTVNHSRHFADPETGANTNTVEGTNSGLKTKIPVRNRVFTGIERHIGEYIWRRVNNNDLWAGFIKALREIDYEFQ